MTNRQLAIKLGLGSADRAAKVRDGRILPNADELYRISKVFGLPAAELLDAHHRGADFFGRYLRTHVPELQEELLPVIYKQRLSDS